MPVWILQKIEYYWGLFLQLDPATAILLLLTYGLIFEILYVQYLSAVNNQRKIRASNLSVILYCISLFGLSEVLTRNIMYVLPIIIGTWAGNYIQITIEKRRSEREDRASGEEDDKDKI